MIDDNLAKINQILEIVKIMQQERSGAFLVLLSIDIPPVDCRFILLLFVFVFTFLCLLLFVFDFLFCPFCLFFFLFLFILFFL